MTLRTVYPAGLWATTTLAMLAVLLGGAMPFVSWLALLAPVFCAWRLARGKPAASAFIGTLIALAGPMGGVAIVAAYGIESAVLATSFALLAALAGRLYSRAGLRHDLQAFLLSLLLVFAGAGLHTQLTYGLVFSAFAVAAAVTLSARQLWVVSMREGVTRDEAGLALLLSRRDLVTWRFLVVTAGTALVVLLLTSVIFVLFPRVGLGTLRLMVHRNHALPEGVRLDAAPRAAGGGEVVARVRGLDFEAFDRGLYLRLATYDRLTREGFVQSASSGPPGWPLARSGANVAYEVFLQPIGDRALATLGAASKVEIDAVGGQGLLVRTAAFVRRDGTAWATVPIGGPMRYRVYGDIVGSADADRYLQTTPPTNDGLQLPGVQAEPYLELPAGIDRRIVALAREVVAEAPDAAQKARRLRRFLRAGYGYSLDQSNSGKPDPLASFLFEDKRGHCEFFATALATLLRASGVPARVVVGFAGGVWDDRDNVVVFTEASAHAWIEWYQAGVGWVTDDATPAGSGGAARLTGLTAWIERVSRAWDENVLEYGLERQMSLWRSAADLFRAGELKLPAGRSSVPWSWVIAIGGLVVGAVVLRRLRRRRRVLPAQRLGVALARACAPWLGRAPRASETLRTAVTLAGHRAPEVVSGTLFVVLKRYEHARFGEVALDARELGSWLRRLRQVRRARQPGRSDARR